jgi:hypothetical protein
VLLAGVATIMNDSDDEENFGHDALGPPPERVSRRLRASVLKRDGNYCLVYGSMNKLTISRMLLHLVEWPEVTKSASVSHIHPEIIY